MRGEMIHQKKARLLYIARSARPSVAIIIIAIALIRAELLDMKDVWVLFDWSRTCDSTV